MALNSNQKIGARETLSFKTTQWIGTPASLVVHTIIFVVAIALLYFEIFPVDEVLLVLTTAVSLEAIYLAIFIQMAVNRSNQSLTGVEKDIDEIQEDVDEISEDIDELSEDVEEISEDIDEIQEDTAVVEKHDSTTTIALTKIEDNLQKIVREIEDLKTKQF
ncbi:MAG: hypothetical protein ABIH10_01010 [Spirochaetota bacterium]